MEKSLDILWEKVQGMQKAQELADKLNEEKLKLQAAIYDKHLSDLNHEGDRIKEVQKQSIPREVFDRTMIEVNAKLAIVTKWQDSQQGSSMNKDKVVTYIPYLIALAALALAFFRSK